jgi:hypothetical protein
MPWKIISGRPYFFNSVAKVTDDEGEYFEFLEYGDDTSLWRRGVRGGKFVLDHSLTGLWSTEGVDWENVKSIG